MKYLLKSRKINTFEEEVIKYIDLFTIEPTEIIKKNLICYKLFKKRI